MVQPRFLVVLHLINAPQVYFDDRYLLQFSFQLGFFYLIIRKSINTNGNTKGIISLVNYQRIFPKEIFPRYLPRELQWEK
jgi:hypothetical protein